MEGHKIILSTDFLQDFCVTKHKTYSKTETQQDGNLDRSCRPWEHKLANCLAKYYNTIQESSTVIDDRHKQDKTSKDFRNILQCSQQFKEYEECIAKIDQ